MKADKSKLLHQLRIDRSGSKPGGSGGGSRGPWLAAGAILIALLGAGAAWYQFFRPVAVPVKVAVARQLAGGEAGGPAESAVIEATGYVVARREATVAPKIAGRLEQLFIEEGAHVAGGAIIAKLDDSNAQAALRQAQGGIRLAEATLAQAKLAAVNGLPLYRREQEQAAAGFISAHALQIRKSDYDALQTAVAVADGGLAVAQGALSVAQQAVADTIVRAPFGGVVTSRAAQPGEIVSPISSGGGTIRTGIATLVDMDSLEVEVDVNQNFINKLRAGQAATLRLDAYADWKIPAQIVAIVPTASRSKGTVKVRVGFKVKDPRIVPEMGVHVSFLSDAQPGAPAARPAARRVVVPAESVQAGADGGSAFVYVIAGATIKRRDVVLGSREREGQVIVSGLTAGDRVAVSGFEKLRDGVSVDASDI